MHKIEVLTYCFVLYACRYMSESEAQTRCLASLSMKQVLLHTEIIFSIYVPHLQTVLLAGLEFCSEQDVLSPCRPVLYEISTTEYSAN